MKARKGNYNFDFLIALVFFLVYYMSIFSLTSYPQFAGKITHDPLLEEGTYFDYVLTQTTGYPQNWTNINETQSLGLAYYNYSITPNVLDYNKVAAINNINCESLQGISRLLTKFKVSIVTSSATYSCNATISPTSRLIERPITIREYNQTTNKINYTAGEIKIWTW